ncbi:MAG TPA: hypothetical protein VGK00_03585 [Anaerolineales bacterium]|jgi:hypothetical protein
MSHHKDDFNLFEARLAQAFRPVRPSSQYVQAIRQRIKFKAPVEVAERLSNRPSLLLIFGSVLSVSLLIITAGRAIFYLTSRSKV